MTQPVWPTQKAGDFRQHIKINFTGREPNDKVAFNEAIQKAIDVGYSLGEKHARAKMEHPALDAFRDKPSASKKQANYEDMVRSHRQTIGRRK